jgi:hypothetical protein
MLGDYRVEIEDSGSGQVVLSIPAVRLIVMGRTLSEAEELARAALAFRRQDLARPPSGRRHAQPISPTRPTRCRARRSKGGMRPEVRASGVMVGPRRRPSH